MASTPAATNPLSPQLQAVAAATQLPSSPVAGATVLSPRSSTFRLSTASASASDAPAAPAPAPAGYASPLATSAEVSDSRASLASLAGTVRTQRSAGGDSVASAAAAADVEAKRLSQILTASVAVPPVQVPVPAAPRLPPPTASPAPEPTVPAVATAADTEAAGDGITPDSSVSRAASLLGGLDVESMASLSSMGSFDSVGSAGSAMDRGLNQRDHDGHRQQHQGAAGSTVSAASSTTSYSSFFRSSLEKFRWGSSSKSRGPSPDSPHDAAASASQRATPSPSSSAASPRNEVPPPVPITAEPVAPAPRSPSRAGIPHTGQASSDSLASLDDDVDWEFWGKLMQDYESVSRKHPKNLHRAVCAGIPSKLRGPVWLLMSGARTAALEREFQRLLPLPSPFEKLIQRDLPRTFPGHPFFAEPGGPGQDALYNVVKAYSLYDTEVGYCQGIAFVAGPLLLQLPDEEAFCVLVKLLTSYGLRGHYTPHMEGLHLRMFQFDKLLQELMPHVHSHLTREGVRSTMYASQWFMTLFAYRFPLDLVLRVFDMIFAEGSDILLKFALALIKRHEATLLTLEFETLLDYLKTGVFDHYATATGGTEFVEDALRIRFSKRQLDAIAAQYDAEVKLGPDGHVAALDELKETNKRLEGRIKTLEKNLELINQEHVDLANELIQTKMDQARLRDANESMAKQLAELRALVLEERQRGDARHVEAVKYRDAEKAALKEQNDMLALQLQEMQDELVTTKLKFAESESDRDTLHKKLNQLKRAMDL
ncbi:GTPase-activating protein [Blastocladiella emersonii ATCC 22665]|nr:GTPase-activating protein [Blastocladiella emersonii ATCC 22665]